MATTPHYACLKDALARIKALGLPEVGGVGPPNVVAARLPTDRPPLVTLPAVVVSFGGQETLEDGDLEDSAFGYPVVVSIVSAANQAYAVAAGDEPVLAWRKAVRDLFLDLPASGAAATGADAYDVRVEFGPVIDPTTFHGDNVWLSQLVLRYRVTEARNRN